MKILITGGAGYKGTVLTSKLLGQGYAVTIIDNFMYGYEPIMHLATNKNLEIIKHDIRNGIPDIQRYDVIFHLAGISGFPACASNPHSAQLINVEATRLIAQDLAGGQMLINASTTSLYGKSGLPCNEETAVDPVSTYARTKLAAEEILHEKPNVISLRFATVFGFSTRMRMDLIVNTMFKSAMTQRQVTVNHASIWRPILDIRDAAMAYLRAIQADYSINGVFNVTSGNYTVGHVGDMVKHRVEKLTGERVAIQIKQIQDFRNYKVTIERAKTFLGFQPQYSIEDIIEDLYAHVADYGDYSQERFYNIRVFQKMMTQPKSE